MDKKSWIIVTICCALLGVQFYLNNEHKKEQEAAQALAAQRTPAQTAGAPAAPATPAAAAAQPAASPQTVAEQARTAPAGAPREIASLAVRDGDGNPVARFAFSDVGGSVRYAEMSGKAINSIDAVLKNHDVRLNEGASFGVGNLMYNLGEQAAPIYDNTVYSVTAQTPTMVELTGRTPDGRLTICKQYSLKPVSKEEERAHRYMLTLNIKVQNNTSEDLAYANWGLFAGSSYPISQAEGERYTYIVAADADSFHKNAESHFHGMFSGDKSREYKTDFNNLSWAGVMNQYYATLVIPAKDSTCGAVYSEPGNFNLEHENANVKGVSAAVGLPAFDLPRRTETAPGGLKTFRYDLYIGPKLNQMLSEMPFGIDRVMDYGWLTLISVPMNWLINLFHGWFGNWGWAIIGMTIVVRGLIWPLHRKSFMAMKRMSLVQPKIQELKEKYGDDKQKINMETMKIYQQYGINPASGCLPMFLQIPIFFAFFYVLQTAAEFRGQPFIFWIHDLSQPDTVGHLFGIPINVLPLIMAVTMVIQMKLTPKAGDPTQQKIMAFMPLMFFFFCYSYPSALALYWTTQNIISIGQSYLIRKMPMPELKKVQRKKGGFFQRMMEAQRAALEEQQRKAKTARR